MLKTHRPHLVLLNPLMPGIDGIEFMEQVQDLADLTGIFISGYGHNETAAGALEAEAVDYTVLLAD